MRKLLLVAITLLFAVNFACAQQMCDMQACPMVNQKTGLVPPPQINMPYGCKLTAEMNFSNEDVLKTMSTMLDGIPGLINVVAPMAPVMGAPAGVTDIATGIDINELKAIFADIKAVRVLVTEYKQKSTPEKLLAEINTGAAKSGYFSRIMYVNDEDVILAVYADKNNGGYLCYFKDRSNADFIGARVIGDIDYEKLMGWITKTAKSVMEAKMKAAINNCDDEENDIDNDDADNDTQPDAQNTNEQ